MAYTLMIYKSEFAIINLFETVVFGLSIELWSCSIPSAQSKSNWIHVQYDSYWICFVSSHIHVKYKQKAIAAWIKYGSVQCVRMFLEMIVELSLWLVKYLLLYGFIKRAINEYKYSICCLENMKPYIDIVEKLLSSVCICPVCCVPVRMWNNVAYYQWNQIFNIEFNMRFSILGVLYVREKCHLMNCFELVSGINTIFVLTSFYKNYFLNRSLTIFLLRAFAYAYGILQLL